MSCVSIHSKEVWRIRRNPDNDEEHHEHTDREDLHDIETGSDEEKKKDARDY